MAFVYEKTGGAICADALQHLGALGLDEVVNASDMLTCLRGLDGILKELAPYGVHWPQLSSEQSLAWTGVQLQTLPADYYGYPLLYKTVDSNKVLLNQLTHAEWVDIQTKTATGTTTSFYVNPAGGLMLWPVATVDPVLTLQYQRIIPDADLTVDVAIPTYWISALGYGVADAVALKFGADKSIREEVSMRWKEKRLYAMESSVSFAPISFSIAD